MRFIILITLLAITIGCTVQCPPESPIREGEGKDSYCRIPTPVECLVGLDCSYASWDGTQCACLETSACIAARGIQLLMEECDGSTSEVCDLTESWCYLDQVKDGKCPEEFSPRVLCDSVQ